LGRAAADLVRLSKTPAKFDDERPGRLRPHQGAGK
jgi:hypothetical protein